MGFAYSSKGIEQGFPGLPDGVYTLKIVKAETGTTKNGDTKVTVDYIVESGPYAGRQIRYHIVTFFENKKSPGASIALHYLHCIGEPYEGDFTVEPSRWLGRALKSKVVTEKTPTGDYPKVKFVQSIAEHLIDEEESPF